MCYSIRNRKLFFSNSFIALWFTPSLLVRFSDVPQPLCALHGKGSLQILGPGRPGWGRSHIPAQPRPRGCRGGIPTPAWQGEARGNVHTGWALRVAIGVGTASDTRRLWQVSLLDPQLQPHLGVTRAHFVMTTHVFVSCDSLDVSVALKRAISWTATRPWVFRVPRRLRV